MAKFENYLNILRNQVAKIIINEYRYHGDISNKSVDIDIETILKREQTGSFSDLLLGIAVLVNEGYISIKVPNPTQDFLYELAHSVASLDVSYMFKEINAKKYESLVNTLFNFIDSSKETKYILLQNLSKTINSKEANIHLNSILGTFLTYRIYWVSYLLLDKSCNKIYILLNNVNKNINDKYILNIIKEEINFLRDVISYIINLSREYVSLISSIDDVMINRIDNNIMLLDKLSNIINKIEFDKVNIINIINSIGKICKK